MELDFIRYLIVNKRELSIPQRDGLAKFLKNLDMALDLYLEKPDQDSIKVVLTALAGPRRSFDDMKYPNCNLTMLFRSCRGCPCVTGQHPYEVCSAIMGWSQMLRGGDCSPELFLHFMQLKAQLEIIK